MCMGLHSLHHTGILPSPFLHACWLLLLQESEEGEDGRFKYGVSAMQGWRTEMVRVLGMVVSTHRVLLSAGGLSPRLDSARLHACMHACASRTRARLLRRRMRTVRCWTWTPPQARGSLGSSMGTAARRSPDMRRSTWCTIFILPPPLTITAA